MKAKDVHGCEFITSVLTCADVLHTDVVLLDDLGETGTLDSNDGSIDVSSLRQNIAQRVARHARGGLVFYMGANVVKGGISVQSISIENNKGFIEEFLCGEQCSDSAEWFLAIRRGDLEGVTDRQAEKAVSGHSVDSAVCGVGHDDDDGGHGVVEELTDGKLEKGLAAATDLLQTLDIVSETRA